MGGRCGSVITATELMSYRTSADDYDETQALKSLLARLRVERRPLYLAGSEFERILMWKLRTQYGRQQERRKANTEDVIRAVTGLALTITHPDAEYETELRLAILCALRGVSVSVGSAVLALTFPERYGVIDYRGWRQVFGSSRTVFTIPDYQRYLRQLRVLAGELAWPVQEVDLAIWEYDRRHGPPDDLTSQQAIRADAVGAPDSAEARPGAAQSQSIDAFRKNEE
jgi:hypothetical protein